MVSTSASKGVRWYIAVVCHIQPALILTESAIFSQVNEAVCKIHISLS